MRFAGRILGMDWLPNKKSSAPKEVDPDEEIDIKVAELSDDGGIYLISIDWNATKINEWVEESGFVRKWENYMHNTGLCVIQGSMVDDGDVEIVHTSLEEVFEHEEEEG